ncbi:hypothetical protein [Sinomonas albida]|uniref:hypothetical protein n=1 Tax=Sinomonas albida TaxID=369942 RepID=UPI0010A7688A|nr:hypothetical protein [Sinomonas albida]
MDEDRPVAPKRRRWVWIIGVSAVVVAVIATCTIWASIAIAQSQAQSAADSVSASASASASAAASRSKAASDAFWAQVAQDNRRIYASESAFAKAFNDSQAQDQMTAQGFVPIASGIYRKDGNFHCTGSLPCTMFYLTVTKACPGGVYVEASAIQNGVSVGRADDLTAALKPGDEAVITLTDTSGMANQFKITSATCE